MAAVGGGDRGENLGVHTRVVVGGEAADGGVVECGHGVQSRGFDLERGQPRTFPNPPLKLSISTLCRLSNSPDKTHSVVAFFGGLVNIVGQSALLF